MGSTQDHTAYCRPSFLGADPWFYCRQVRIKPLGQLQSIGPGISSTDREWKITWS